MKSWTSCLDTFGFLCAWVVLEISIYGPVYMNLQIWTCCSCTFYCILVFGHLGETFSPEMIQNSKQDTVTPHHMCLNWMLLWWLKYKKKNVFHLFHASLFYPPGKYPEKSQLPCNSFSPIVFVLSGKLDFYWKLYFIVTLPDCFSLLCPNKLLLVSAVKLLFHLGDALENDVECLLAISCA